MRINLRSVYDSFPEKYGESDKQINFYVDNNVYFLENTDRNEHNAIALLVEPRSIIPGTYQWVQEHADKFRYIFTFDSELLELPNAKLLIYGQITAEFPDTPKTKNISMVASDKDFCEGHRNRQEVAWKLIDIIDTYGKFNGGEYCDDKDYLSEYRFNICMENYSDGYYFTEKICNCFASRVVPIYWGCPHIEEYFDTNGIIYCRTPDEVIEKVKQILIDPIHEYEKRKDAIEKNFKEVQRYRRYADLFLKTYGSLLEGISTEGEE